MTQTNQEISLKDVPLLKGLSEAELQSVRSCLKEHTFKKGERLFAEGADCGRIFMVQSGRVKIYRLSQSGREQILETLGPGDTCACNPGSINWFCGSSGEALTPVTAWFLSREDYVRMVQTNIKISQKLNQLFADRLQCFSNLIEEVSLKDAKKRLVKFILDMVSSKKNHPVKGAAKEILYIPFTREEIAQRLGTSRETVARYLSQLKKSKLIDIKPYQLIILNQAGLEKLLA